VDAEERGPPTTSRPKCVPSPVVGLRSRDSPRPEGQGRWATQGGRSCQGLRSGTAARAKKEAPGGPAGAVKGGARPRRRRPPRPGPGRSWPEPSSSTAATVAWSVRANTPGRNACHFCARLSRYGCAKSCGTKPHTEAVTVTATVSVSPGQSNHARAGRARGSVQKIGTPFAGVFDVQNTPRFAGGWVQGGWGMAVDPREPPVLVGVGPSFTERIDERGDYRRGCPAGGTWATEARPAPRLGRILASTRQESLRRSTRSYGANASSRSPGPMPAEARQSPNKLSRVSVMKPARWQTPARRWWLEPVWADKAPQEACHRGGANTIVAG